MSPNTNHIDDLIGKYLAREASAEESAQVESWINQSEVNRNYFDQFKLIFSRAATIKELPSFDTDIAWKKVRSKLHQKKDGKVVKLETNTGKKFYWQIAASIIFILGAGFFTYKFLPSSVPTSMEVTTGKATEADTLPDGSGVFLNRETRLAYDYNPLEKSHRVTLKGEAYFDIHHDDSKEFIVQVDDVLIRDIGTSFNVKAYPESGTIEVAVEEGKVMFYTETDSGVFVVAGEKGVYHKATRSFSIEGTEPNITAYKTRFFAFNDDSLDAVVQTLNDVYDRKLVIADSLKHCRLTVSFNNENIEEIAGVIAETLGLRVKTTDSAIILEGAGCEK